jgi:diaminohydroxyphosphoribosylaminopyrimidine deaminase/5-amino-6-(5-phosphoribosylamino)uracil reductase
MLVEEADILPSLMTRLYESGIQSVLVEGGQFLLQSLIDAGLWDEVRIITNKSLFVSKGLKSPVLTGYEKIKDEKILSDEVVYYKNINNKFVING